MRIFAVTNMYPRPAWPASGVFVEQQVEGLRQIGVDVDVFLFDRETLGMGVYRQAAAEFHARLSDFHPDIVHVMYGGVMASQVVGQVRHVPTVVTFHGSDVLGEPLAGPVRRVLGGYGVLCSRRAARRADRVIAVSRVVARALPARVVPHVRIVPCGIDLERFTPSDSRGAKQALGWDPSVFHVLFPASPHNPIKRSALATSAIEELRRAGVATELHFLQGLSNNQVPLWMNAADCLLLTSEHEGSPTVVKEALACNLAVVSVDVGDVAERIEGIAGCYLAEATPSRLAARLNDVVGRHQRIDGRSHVQALSHVAIARTLHDIYLELSRVRPSLRATSSPPEAGVSA